jgi:hypothetical protein
LAASRTGPASAAEAAACRSSSSTAEASSSAEAAGAGEAAAPARTSAAHCSAAEAAAHARTSARKCSATEAAAPASHGRAGARKSATEESSAPPLEAGTAPLSIHPATRSGNTCAAPAAALNSANDFLRGFRCGAVLALDKFLQRRQGGSADRDQGQAGTLANAVMAIGHPLRQLMHPRIQRRINLDSLRLLLAAALSGPAGLRACQKHHARS